MDHKKSAKGIGAWLLLHSLRNAHQEALRELIGAKAAGREPTKTKASVIQRQQGLLFPIKDDKAVKTEAPATAERRRA